MTGLTLQTGGTAGAEGADGGVSGQAARGPPRSADAAGRTARRPGADGELAEGEPGPSESGEGPHRLWTGAGSSADSGHHKENG